ncbi:MAG TPA: hypothetical protein VGB55_06115 [Tepidisphaeraceae bacterium]
MPGKKRSEASSPVETAPRGGVKPPWTFLTNHSHVLICLWRDPEARLRDVADQVAITERAVQAIVADLEAGGMLTRIRQGRRNHYQIHEDVPLRHPVEANRNVAALLKMVGKDAADK